jgi:hypothetical protein
MTDRDLFNTQRDEGPAVVSELSAAGFEDAEEIGRGGFGIVHRCTQVALDRTVTVRRHEEQLRKLERRPTTGSA